MFCLRNPLLNQVVDRGNSFIIFKCMYQIIFVQIRQVTECLKCDIFFEMFIQILFDEPTVLCDLLCRSNGLCCLCLTSDNPDDQLQKILADGFKIFFFFFPRPTILLIFLAYKEIPEVALL